MTLKVKINGPSLNTSWEESIMHVWWFQLKFVMSFHADKIKFTDGETDRWIDEGNIKTPPAWKAKG